MSSTEPPWGSSPPSSASLPALGSAVGPDAGRVSPEPPAARRISGCAWAGIAMGLAAFVAIGGFVAAVLLGDEGGRAASGRRGVAELDVGMCVRVPDGGVAPGSVALERCDAPHEGEVYAVGALADGAFPGDVAAQDRAARWCVGPFEPFVGIPFADSVLEVTVLSPTEERWRNGDRAVACIAHDRGGADLPAGSVGGTRR